MPVDIQKFIYIRKLSQSIYVQTQVSIAIIDLCHTAAAAAGSSFYFTIVITLFLGPINKRGQPKNTSQSLRIISQHFETNVDGRPATKADEISHNIHPLNTQQTEPSNDRDFRWVGGGSFFFLIKIPQGMQVFPNRLLHLVALSTQRWPIQPSTRNV